jgi:hypothetical protein
VLEIKKLRNERKGKMSKKRVPGRSENKKKEQDISGRL